MLREIEGAMSSLAIAVSGIITVILASVFAKHSGELKNLAVQLGLEVSRFIIQR